MFYITETKLRLNSFKSVQEDDIFAIHAPENGVLPNDTYVIFDKSAKGYFFDHELGYVVCEGIEEAEETINKLKDCIEEEIGLD